MERLRVGVLCSHRAPGLTYLLDKGAGRGRAYDVVCCLTSEESFADSPAAAARGVPVIAHPIRRFCLAYGRPLPDLEARAAYDAATAARLAPYRLDLVVLASYLYVLTAPMLGAYRDRIVNLHHADLTIRRPDATPWFPGLRAVRDAIVAGADETRATVHLVTEQLDGGAPFLRSWPFAVSPLAADAIAHGALDVFKAYAWAHQEWMIRTSWGPLQARALELIAAGGLDLGELARVPLAALEPPWDLGADGVLRGAGPLAPPGAAVRVA